MTGKERYDAIIVGARAAGAATAMLMARRGMKVLAVDRARYGSDTLSTHALMRTGVLQLHRWGLLHRVKSTGATPVNRVVFHYPDETMRVEIRPSDGVDALYAPRRTVLDPLLVDAAREAGADVRFGVIVDDLLKDGSGRVVGISARDEQAGELELSADLVVGADGIRSIVAQSVNAEVIRRAHNSGAAVYGYYSGVKAAGYEWAYAPGVSAGLIPTNDGQVCVFIGGSEADFRRRVFPSLDRNFETILREASPDLAERVSGGSLEARYRGFAGVRGYIRACQGDGWALVGDAGYFRDPITTHGISDAFRDAEILTRAATGEITMSAYQSTRDSVIGGLFGVTDRIAGYDWSMKEIRGYLRDVSRTTKPELELIERMDSAEAA
jgi:flavin-dependent dehydrogenase